MADVPTNQLSRDALNIITSYLAYLYIYIDNAHIPMADVPLQKLRIGALNTITPYLADLYKYIEMHIYLWQMFPPIN